MVLQVANGLKVLGSENYCDVMQNVGYCVGTQKVLLGIRECKYCEGMQTY